MTVTIYHNPHCSKSRQTLELIQQRRISPKIIEYLKTELTKKELEDVLKLLRLEARQIVRNGEAIYRELGLDDPDLTEDQLLQAILDNPILLQRPIVIANNKAAIGRPPETVLDIL